MRCNASLPSWLKPFPMLLRNSGYYCTNNSKTDYQFSKPSVREIWDQSGSRAHWKNRKEGQPFFAVFNYTGCHESGIASINKYKAVTANLKPDQRQDPEKISTLPPYYPDTPVVREDWKRNYELITAMDSWAGSLINEIKEAGLYEDTIIFSGLIMVLVCRELSVGFMIQEHMFHSLFEFLAIRLVKLIVS